MERAVTTNTTREQGTGPRLRAETLAGDVAGLLLLRVGLGGVLVWFGAAELHSPAAWAVYVPHMFHAVQSPLMFVHATFLLVTGALLVIGMFHRIAAWLGGLILLAILGALVLTGAVDSVFVRDVGLAAAAFALALSPTAASLPGVDRWLAQRSRRAYVVPALSYAVLLAAVVGVLAATSVSSGGSSQAFNGFGGLGGTTSAGGSSAGASAASSSKAGSGSSLGALGGLGASSKGGVSSGGPSAGAPKTGGSTSGSSSTHSSVTPSGGSAGSRSAITSPSSSIGAMAPTGSGH
ncbi:MAG TPA: hypothetical protein VKB31_02955 [Trueperaceae bacterium]|nr:hypothetical protein [Trueperaceae bacterium]